MSKVALFTNFQDVNPGYSLTGIVLDQIKMLTRYGHYVDVLTSVNFNKKDLDKFPTENVTVKHVVPFAHLVDYTSVNDVSAEHKLVAQNTAAMLRKELADVDYCLAHDIIFLGWNVPYALGVQQASPDLRKVRWFHWIHSVPSSLRDWWNIRLYGTTHRLVFPNKTEKIRVAEQFRGSPRDVKIIPHIKDIRTWYEFGQDTCDFIDAYPKILTADIVEVLPASTDRLAAKGVQDVIGIFGHIKKRGFSVCLVVANQWATGKQQKEDLQKYYKLAVQAGLELHEEFIFTSEWKEQVAIGIPRRMLRELFQCANLFIFPTREESFGLVVPEAALAGMYCVFNKSLSMMMEITGLNGIFFDFGSFHQQINITDMDGYYKDIATLILGRMAENEAIMLKTFMKRAYNYDTLYNKYYAPMFAESALWAN
jgi:glycosyltransferase involved in cell wall biosynthesis